MSPKGMLRHKLTWSLLEDFLPGTRFFPVLPVDMLHLTTAPMPFMMGVHTSRVALLAQMPLEEVMVIDLDANTVQDWAGGPPTELSGPSRELLPLLQNMAASPLMRFGTVDPVSPVAEEDVEELGLKEYVRVYTAKLERSRIQRVLGQEEGNVTRASRKLGISRKSLQTKMKEYGLRDLFSRSGGNSDPREG